MKSLLFTLCLLSTTAHADTWLVANVASHHFSKDKFNEQNYGLGIEYVGSNDVTYAAGFYDNSINRHSNYIAAAYTPIAFSQVHIGIFAGAVTGYQGHGINPFAGAMGKMEFEKLGVNLLLTPSTQYSPTTAAIQFKWRFK